MMANKEYTIGVDRKKMVLEPQRSKELKDKKSTSSLLLHIHLRKEVLYYEKLISSKH